MRQLLVTARCPFPPDDRKGGAREETKEPCGDFVDAPGLRVSYGEAYVEMEESSADVVGYGMSVVAKDTGPWCSLRRRSTSRRQTSASPRPADCEMPVYVPLQSMLVASWRYGALSPWRRRQHGEARETD